MTEAASVPKFSVAKGDADAFKTAPGAGRKSAPFEAKMVKALEQSYATKTPVRFTAATAEDIKPIRREVLRWGRVNEKSTALRPLNEDGDANYVDVLVGDVRKRKSADKSETTAAGTADGSQDSGDAAPKQSPEEGPAS